MSTKPQAFRQIQTRSKTRKERAHSQPDSEFCVCPSKPMTAMNDDQKEEFKQFFTNFMQSLRTDFEKESTTNRAQLDSLQTALKKKSSTQHLKPEVYDGNPVDDALAWLDTFQRISKLNNWTPELQLNAFPLYLKGVAQAWFLALPEDTTTNLPNLLAAFRERFASGPQDWILSQKLGARKQQKGETLDNYLADMTRLCKRLNLSDSESMRYFMEGLQRDLQEYVALARPKNLQEAINFARIKDAVNQRQGNSDSSSVLSQMQAMFTKFLATPTPKPEVVAAATASNLSATAANSSTTDKRIDDLSRQVKQILKLQQNQQTQQQQAATNYAVAAYDQPRGQARPPQERNWQGPPNRQVDQLQRQINRLENELRRYQNPRRPDFRSFGRSYRSTEGEPICSFCNRVGHTWRNCRERNRDPRLPTTNSNGPTRATFSNYPGNRPSPSNLNG